MRAGLPDPVSEAIPIGCARAILRPRLYCYLAAVVLGGLDGGAALVELLLLDQDLEVVDALAHLVLDLLAGLLLGRLQERLVALVVVHQTLVELLVRELRTGESEEGGS